MQKKSKTTKKVNGRKIIVTLTGDATLTKQVYIVGNIDELGAWDAKKAVKMSKRLNTYSLIVADKSELIEFKVINKLDWSGVEKGINFEEISNHLISGKDVKIEVANWAN